MWSDFSDMLVGHRRKKTTSKLEHKSKILTCFPETDYVSLVLRHPDQQSKFNGGFLCIVGINSYLQRQYGQHGT
jgi:hypothetical protein